MQSSVKQRFLSYPKPTVLKNTLNEKWRSIPCGWNALLEQCGSILLDFRVVPKSEKGPVWENECEKIEASISDFTNWIMPGSPSESNPFVQYSTKDSWVYSGYNYIGSKFPEDNKMRKNLDWSLFGVNDSQEKHSSFWIGSEGAYTPCHIDTYGFNLVVQIIGRKQWILFPPEDTNCMYPTRIPYEESSIFSSVDILNPNIQRHPLFQKSHPHVVTLEPGDVLFVPEKWWHFVHSLDNSVSVNRWIDLESDDERRLEEAIAKTLFATFSNILDPVEEEWITSPEEWISFMGAVESVKQALHQVSKTKTSSSRDDIPEDELSGCTASKIPKLNTKITEQNHENLFKNVQIVPSVPFSNFLKEYCNKIIVANTEVKDYTSNTLNLQSLVNCFLHPEVISCISKQVKTLISE